MASLPLPRGFRAHVTNIGVKDTTKDLDRKSTRLNSSH